VILQRARYKCNHEGCAVYPLHQILLMKLNQREGDCRPFKYEKYINTFSRTTSREWFHAPASK